MLILRFLWFMLTTVYYILRAIARFMVCVVIDHDRRMVGGNLYAKGDWSTVCPRCEFNCTSTERDRKR